MDYCGSDGAEEVQKNIAHVADKVARGLAILLVTTAVTYPPVATATATAKSSDAVAIRDFAKQLSNPPPSWVHGGNVCTFDGITCDSGRVIGINLTDKGLQGTLTPLLSTLTALETLELRGNKLTGALPSLAGLTSLTSLVLSDNEFTTLPYDFFQGVNSLRIVIMDNLPIEPWIIPEAIGDCTQLQIFSASNVSITGALPTALANLKSLTILWLSYNYLRGSLPVWLGEMSSLEMLGLDNQMSDEKLSGNIYVLASFKSMKQLWIQSNAFTGTIPDFSNSQLGSLDVSNNMLTGLVPGSLMGLESLQSVELSDNFLQGPYPLFQSGVMGNMSGNRFCLHEPGPCDPQVSTLLEVASGFGFPLQLAKAWAGNNPCNGSWVGIVCKGSVIVEVNLTSQNLSGTISQAFGNLSMLERLDLSENQLTGVIPESLTTLSHLKFLNVSNNDLSGLLPRFKRSVEVVAEGNHLGSRSSNSKAQKNWIIVGIIVGSITAIVIIVLFTCFCVYYLKKKNASGLFTWLFIYYLKKKKKNASGLVLRTQLRTRETVETTSSSHQTTDYAHYSMTVERADSSSHSVSHLEKLPLHVLEKATNNFNENMIIGRGGSADVFKGTLNGEPVAVKRFKRDTSGNQDEKKVLSEIDIGKPNHRNLVKLLGYCTHTTEKLLVYEYMSGGTLREHLQQPGGYNPLTWAQRIKICLDVAKGIEYLHGLAEPAFIHRDLKTSNILLDQDLRAKVSDFGLVRNITDETSTEIVGTFGYIAPEYAESKTVSSKTDVYSYGVVLMEMITGRKVLDDSLPEDHRFLGSVFQKNFLDKDKFKNMVDPTLELNGDDWEKLMEVAKFACCCTSKKPDDRPGMDNCVTLLSSMVEKFVPKGTDYEKGETSSMGGKGETSSMEGKGKSVLEMIQNLDIDDITADSG